MFCCCGHPRPALFISLVQRLLNLIWKSKARAEVRLFVNIHLLKLVIYSQVLEASADT